MNETIDEMETKVLQMYIEQYEKDKEKNSIEMMNISRQDLLKRMLEFIKILKK